MPALVGSFGVSVVIALSGVASASNVGAVGNNQSVAISGVSTSVAVGSVAVLADATVALTGVASTPAAGSVGIKHSLSLTSVLATTSAGNISFTESGSVGLIGVSSSSSVGSVGVSKSGSSALTGVLSTSAVGTVSPILGNVAALTGVSSNLAIGNVGFAKGGTLALTGVFASGQVGSVSIKAIPVTTPTTNFSGKIALDLARPGDIEDPATDRAIVFLHDAVELLSQDVITSHNQLTDVTPNQHHNQVHGLYSTDHADIDIANPLVTGSVLTYVKVADGGSDKFVPTPTFVARGYGGIKQTGTPGIPDLGAGFQVVPANAGLIATPAGVTQDHVNDGIKFEKAGVWSINIIISLSHNEDIVGRSFKVQLYNNTDAAEIEATIVPIARNQPGTFISLTFMVEIPVSAEGDLIKIRIGNGSTVTVVILQAYQFSANHISEFTG